MDNIALENEKTDPDCKLNIAFLTYRRMRVAVGRLHDMPWRSSIELFEATIKDLVAEEIRPAENSDGRNGIRWRKNMITVNIAKDFTRFPSGRMKSNGSTSGEGFRELFLEPPLKEGKEITVELDGTIGYGSSFLEEAFGGIVRSLRIPPERLLNMLHLSSSDPALIDEVKEYITDAQKRKTP